MPLSPSFKTVWSREMQEVLWVTNVWRQQANFRLEDELKDGDTVKRVIAAKMVPQNYTRYNNLSFQQANTSSESLTVDTTPTVPFIISDLDDLQSTPKSRKRFTDMAVEQLNTIINGYFTAQVVNAGATIDASDFDGTAGNGVSVTPANITKLFSTAMKKVGRQNVFKYKPGESEFGANITPDIYQILLERLEGKESALGDKLSENGHAGHYMGFDLYVHNGGYWTGTLKLATNPTAGDYIRFVVGDRTITFTFVSSIGSTAGNVLIGGSNDATGANLAALFNAPGTTTANGVALDPQDQAALFGSSATYTAGTDLLTITWRGVGSPIVSDSLTATTDGFDVTGAAGKNISHCLFGRKGAIDMVVQRYPKIQIDPAEDRIEEWKVKPYALFGLKTFADGARKIINVKVDTTNYR